MERRVRSIGSYPLFVPGNPAGRSRTGGPDRDGLLPAKRGLLREDDAGEDRRGAGTVSGGR